MSSLAILGGTPVRTKPFPAWPVFDDAEEQSVLSVLRSGKWWSNWDDGDDSQVATFQRSFATTHGAAYGVACASGTAALEITLRALGIGAGDEVIVPPYTFIATASAPLQVNARPVFCDIEPDTYNLDPDRLEESITPRTKAIIPVHFAGLAADLERILCIANRHGLKIIEDAAHGHGGRWQGKALGSIGDAGTFSFQMSKNMTAGEGGIILTNNQFLAGRCESLVWAGRERGHAWYEHFRQGWNYRLTEIQAAILLQQLKRLERQTQRRIENADYLNRELAAIPGIRVMHQPAYATRHAQHIFLLRIEEERFGMSRQQFVAALNQEGIPCFTGYGFPLFRNPLFWDDPSYHKFEDLCPVAGRACREAIWFEHRLLLGSGEDTNDIVQAVRKLYDFRSHVKSATL